MTNLKKHHIFLLSIAGGLILSAAWPEKGFAPLLFIGFIPFLFIEDHILKNPSKFGRISVFLYTYVGFLAWNILTTWWIWNSTISGAILAWVLNSLMMSVVFQLYHFTRRHIKMRQSLYVLIFYWISFEYFHHNWDGTWPWLSLGNGFATWYKWIQWYEFTGIFGGTLWILLANILFYQLFLKVINKEKPKLLVIHSSLLLLITVLPVILSLTIYKNYKEKQWPVDVVVVQPNVDPYHEQYQLFSYELVERNLSQARKVMDDSVDFIVSPESAIQENIWEDRILESTSLALLKKFMRDYPEAGYVIGASTYHLFQPGEELTPSARKFRSSEGYYDAYNTAVYLDSNGVLKLHHKSKLTPGVEKMPFAKFLKPLENMAIDLGGTVGSLGVDPERTVFSRANDGLKIAPVICYESVFGSYVTDYIRKGANLIFVITNDGWWGNTAGHRQHFTFSRLRAIENRRSIARSANTGISAFINQRGDAFQVTKYWEPAIIRQKINANDKMTFYSLYGDYVGRLSSFIAVSLLLIAISLRLKVKKIE